MSTQASDDSILITGPSKTGKTCWLGSLQVAAGAAELDRSERFSSRLHDISANGTLVALHEAACAVVLGDDSESLQHEGTRMPTEYQFQFTVRDRQNGKPQRRWLPGRAATQPEQSATITVLDTPGGTVWQTKESEIEDPAAKDYQKKLYEFGKVAQRLLLCVDAVDFGGSRAGNPSKTADKEAADRRAFLVKFPRFLHKLANGTLHFDRIAIVLTKADQVYVKNGRKNRELLERKNPWHFATHLLGRGLGLLLGYVDDKRTEIACGWTSAYGFIENEGSANHDPNTNRLLTAGDLLSWYPYRVLDPLVFLTTGHLNSLTKLNRDELPDFQRQSPWD